MNNYSNIDISQSSLSGIPPLGLKQIPTDINLTLCSYCLFPPFAFQIELFVYYINVSISTELKYNRV